MLEYAHDAVIKAADDDATMHSLLRSKDHNVRHAASVYMGQIADMHTRNDYNRAREYQLASDAVRTLPMAVISRLVKKFAVKAVR